MTLKRTVPIATGRSSKLPGWKLKQLMLNRGVSPNKLSDLIGRIAPGDHILNHINGNRPLREEALQACADALGVTLADVSDVCEWADPTDYARIAPPDRTVITSRVTWHCTGFESARRKIGYTVHGVAIRTDVLARHLYNHELGRQELNDADKAVVAAFFGQYGLKADQVFVPGEYRKLFSWCKPSKKPHRPQKGLEKAQRISSSHQKDSNDES